MKSKLAFVFFLIGAVASVVAGVGLGIGVLSSAAWAQASSNSNLSGINVARRDDRLRSQIAAAELAVKQQDWAAALLAWQGLARSGVDTAPAQLCRLYFDARQGSFEGATVTDWCRRAASVGDAGGLYRMGLLYLTGLGVPPNIDQAYAFCAAAQVKAGPANEGPAKEGPANGGQTGDGQVAAKYCLAAIAATKARDASATLADLRTSRTGAVGSNPGISTGTDTGAKAGVSAPDMCERAFIAAGGPFDPAAVVLWCGQAASAGDAEALRRMGLMHLAGLGGPQDLDAAARDCAGANERGQGHVSAAFCLAAVAAERDLLSLASQGVGPALDQVTGRPLPATVPDPFAADRVLDQPHRTAGGLDYTCRKLADWARFEAPGLTILEPRDKAFGKPILAYGGRDFDDLDRAAAACASAISAIAGNDRLRRNLDDFRTSMADLRTRQASLQGEHRQSSAEAAQIAHDQQLFAREQRAQMSEVHVVASLATPQEQTCVEEIRRGVAGSLLGEQTTVEIRNSRRSGDNGNYVVRGEARVMETTGGTWQELQGFSPYTCSFVGRKLANAVLSSPSLGYRQTQTSTSDAVP